MNISTIKMHKLIMFSFVFIILIISSVYSTFQNAHAENLKWFNKDMYNAMADAGNDIHFLFKGATAEQIQDAAVNTYNHPGFTGPTYDDGTLDDGTEVVGVKWIGPVPKDPKCENKIHLGVKLDLDKLPNGGRDLKFFHINLTLDGNSIAGMPGCAKPEVVFVAEGVIGIDITSPFNEPGITIDEVHYSFAYQPIPLAELNGDNMSIEWIRIGEESFDLQPDETIRIADVDVWAGSTHILVTARVRFQGDPELGAGHVFFQSALPMIEEDLDGDGLSDSLEIALGTNPNNPDTDGDGLFDGDEVNTYLTDPLLSDTDCDGLSDGYEVANNMDPLVPNEVTHFEMNLPSGWSMISLPLLSNASVSSLFPDAVVVYGYEREIGYVRVRKEEELRTGEGYWILLDQNQTYNLTGQPFQSYTFPVHEEGWAMIGGCTCDARPTTYDCGIGVIYKYVKGVGYKQVLGTENIEPGKGYWILFNDVMEQAEFKAEAIDSNI